MALSYLTDINLNKNELQNAVIQKVGTDPSSGLTAGWLIYNTASNQVTALSGGNTNMFAGKQRTHEFNIEIFMGIPVNFFTRTKNFFLK